MQLWSNTERHICSGAHSRQIYSEALVCVWEGVDCCTSTIISCPLTERWDSNVDSSPGPLKMGTGSLRLSGIQYSFLDYKAINRIELVGCEQRHRMPHDARNKVHDGTTRESASRLSIEAAPVRDICGRRTPSRLTLHRTSLSRRCAKF